MCNILKYEMLIHASKKKYFNNYLSIDDFIQDVFSYTYIYYAKIIWLIYIYRYMNRYYV